MAKTVKKRPYKVKGHQLFLSTSKVWNQLKKDNKVDKIYDNKRYYIEFFTTLMAPFHWLQRLMIAKKMKAVNLNEQQPLFILGHWRSGTTHLHYIMDNDPQYGTLSNYQNFMFNVAHLSKTWLKFVLSPLMPDKRPQDNVKVDTNAPAEEEQPFSTMSTRSGIHSWYFPKNRSYFDKYNTFKGITPEEKKAWQEDFVECVKNISVYNDNKPLVLKNPHNTGRVKELLELFPDSKFIFIHRNPYDIFLSTRHLYYRMVRTQFLQFVSHKEIDDMIFYFFTKSMKKYLAERHLIPKGNLVDIGYEDLVEKPYENIDKIYLGLNLPNYDKALPEISKYIESVKGYKKNKFRDISPEVVARIQKEFGFAFKEWGYSLEK